MNIFMPIHLSYPISIAVITVVYIAQYLELNCCHYSAIINKHILWSSCIKSFKRKITEVRGVSVLSIVGNKPFSILFFLIFMYM